jgi:hypothetical protein
VVADFIGYERDHGRSTVVEADAGLADWPTWTKPRGRPDPTTFATQCCTHVYADGCAAPGLVCHGTPTDAVIRILQDGRLRSAVSLKGDDGASLAEASSWGEPPDYFEHVMFANGRCTAPEAVANSRRLARDLVPTDLSLGYKPAARFYFCWYQLAELPNAAFDGVHAIKVRELLPLDDLLVAVVVPRSDAPDIGNFPAVFRDRIVVLADADVRPEDWADKAARAAMESR